MQHHAFWSQDATANDPRQGPPQRLRRLLELLVAGCVLTLVGGLWGCERSGQRVKMDKPPNPLTTQRHKPVSGDKLAASRKALVLAAQRNGADAAPTLGGYTYNANATYSYKKADRTVVLKEKFTLEQRADGAFRIRLTNNRNKGYEVRWVGDALYQKERYRPFREISREVAVASRWQRRGFGRWRAMVGLFGKQLVLSKIGTAQHLQRTCVRYRITLGDEAQKLSGLPSGSAWEGPVPNSTRGAAARLQRTLLSAKGRVWIDQRSGIALKVDFTGSYRLGKGKQKTLARITLRASFASLGDPKIKAPAKVVAIKREPDPKDPFAGNDKPGFFQNPPDPRNAKKKRSKRRRRKR